jgi:hypothetical protein
MRSGENVALHGIGGAGDVAFPLVGRGTRVHGDVAFRIDDRHLPALEAIEFVLR